MRESERYARVKQSAEWKETREKYLEKRAQALQSNPKLAEAFREKSNAITRAWRKRNKGDDMQKRVNWTPELDALIGELPDKFIAEKIGVAVGTVINRRKILGKPASRMTQKHYSRHRATTENELTRWRIRSRLAQTDAGELLGMTGPSYARLERNFEKSRTKIVYRLACAAIEHGIGPVE